MISLPHETRLNHARALTRRQFLASGSLSLGSMALTQLAGRAAGPMAVQAPPNIGKAKAVIYLGMSGAPPSLDLFDWKPELSKLNMQPCPESFLKGQRFAFIKGTPKMLGTPFKFAQHGHSGQWFSETVPHMASVADEICTVHSMWTDQFNHAPAELFLYTGNMRAGSASMGEKQSSARERPQSSKSASRHSN